MSSLDPSKLHVCYQNGYHSAEFRLPRRYTLTHSDATGDLFLTISSEYNRRQISGFYTRLMRDEVLAEWEEDNEELCFHVYCHISGGLIVGSAEWRDKIFRQHLRQVLEAFHEGEKQIFSLKPELNKSYIMIHFNSTSTTFNQIEEWGMFENYSLSNYNHSMTGQSQDFKSKR